MLWLNVPTCFYILYVYEQTNLHLLQEVHFAPRDSCGSEVKLQFHDSVTVAGVIEVEHFGAASHAQFLAGWKTAGC